CRKAHPLSANKTSTPPAVILISRLMTLSLSRSVRSPLPPIKRDSKCGMSSMLVIETVSHEERLARSVQFCTTRTPGAEKRNPARRPLDALAREGQRADRPSVVSREGDPSQHGHRGERALPDSTRHVAVFTRMALHRWGGGGQVHL